MPRFSLRSFACAASILSVACGGNDAAMTASVDERISFLEAPSTAAEQKAFAVSRSSGPLGSEYWSALKLIRTGTMRIEVKELTAALVLADSIGARNGGLLADSRMLKGAGDRAEAQIVVRVPSIRFSATVAALRTLGEVEEEVLGTQDITKAYADLDTRVSVKEETVTRLKAILVNRTAKLSDILEAERELARVVSELEQMKGERRFYDQQVAVSSISLTLFEKAIPPVVPNRFTAPIADAFRRSLGVLSASVAGVVYLVSFLIPWTLVAAALWWIAGRTGVRRALSRLSTPRVTPQGG